MDRVLLVSGSKSGMKMFQGLLEEILSANIEKAESAKDARRLLRDMSYGLIVIVTPLKDEFGDEFARFASRTAAGVMLVTKEEMEPVKYISLQEEGIFPFSVTMGKRIFRSGVRLLLSVHKRLCKAAPQAEALQQRIKDIRLVDRAKCMLIQYSRMTEEEAHHFIERQAMDKRVPKREIAEEILKTYDM